MRGSALLSAVSAAIFVVFVVAQHPALAQGETVTVKENFAPGTILVRTSERQLYLFIGNGRAIRYPVGVGREGKQWSGNSHIEGKYIRPDWAPPEVIRHEHPDLPKLIRGGSPRNPMGAAALSLAEDFAWRENCFQADLPGYQSNEVQCRPAGAACLPAPKPSAITFTT